MNPKPTPPEWPEKFLELKETDGWSAFAEFANQMIDHWHGRLSKFNVNEDSIEKIALSRVRWTAMMEGVETLFVQMDSMIREYQDHLKKKEDERAH